MTLEDEECRKFQACSKANELSDVISYGYVSSAQVRAERRSPAGCQAVAIYCDQPSVLPVSVLPVKPSRSIFWYRCAYRCVKSLYELMTAGKSMITIEI